MYWEDAAASLIFQWDEGLWFLRSLQDNEGGFLRVPYGMLENTKLRSKLTKLDGDARAESKQNVSGLETDVKMAFQGILVFSNAFCNQNRGIIEIMQAGFYRLMPVPLKSSDSHPFDDQILHVPASPTTCPCLSL